MVAEPEENQTSLKSIEYEADRMMAQQMLDEQSWKGGNKSHTKGNKKCATQQSDDKDEGGGKSDERGEISRSARDLCALR